MSSHAYQMKNNRLYRAAFEAESARLAGTNGGPQKFAYDAMDEGAKKFVNAEAMRLGQTPEQVVAALNKNATKSVVSISRKSAQAAIGPRPSTAKTSGGPFSLSSLDEGARKFIRGEAARQGKSEEQVLVELNATTARRAARGGR